MQKENMIGQKLNNRYEIIKEIGKGSFGKTYLAKDHNLFQKNCLVKYLTHSESETLEKAQELFKREALILSNLKDLKSSQIPDLYDYFQQEREFFLVQEWIDGHDLSKEIIAGKKLSQDTVIKLLKDILFPLNLLHQQGIIHRDLKPSNIMRRKEDGKIILIDFGAVKEVSATSSNTIIGTKGYCPPEQGIGKPVLASDIYAVGMIAIQALSGISPEQLNSDTNTCEILWQNLVSVDADFAQILTKMVRYNAGDRYKNAQEVLNALNNKYTPLPSTILSKAPFWTRKKVFISGLIVLVLLGLMGIGINGIRLCQSPSSNSSSKYPCGWKW